MKWLRRILYPRIRCDFCKRKFDHVYIWRGYQACNPCIVERVQKGCPGPEGRCMCTNGIGCINVPFDRW